MSTPLTVPASAIPSTAGGPLPPRLRSALNQALLASNSIPAIQAALLHECQATGFVAALRARVRELLRSGAAGTYGEVMAAVMAEVRGEREGLKVPAKVVEEGVKVVRSALEGVVEIGDD